VEALAQGETAVLRVRLPRRHKYLVSFYLRKGEIWIAAAGRLKYPNFALMMRSIAIAPAYDLGGG
jgi:hypothetical protein